MSVIGICGGIGAGKSVVCKMLRAMGYDVFDCDIEARILMDSDTALKCAINETVAPGCLLEDGSLDRKHISRIVFADKARLQRLNSLVHAAVKDAFQAWLDDERRTSLHFFETAIPVTSGLDAVADEIWEVTAPIDVRIARVMERSALTPDEIRARILAQEGEHVSGARAIVNDGVQPVLPQLEGLLGGIF